MDNAPTAPDPNATCPQCGAAIEPGTSAGLCPRCLMRMAMEPTPTATLSTPDPALLAAAFPQYEIEALLGRGGMGAVYRARHRKLGRTVAIKVLLADHGEPEFTERFEREARALAQLDHPSIVGVHDIGETEHFCFLVMDHVDGTDLRRLMAQGQLTVQDALDWIPQICDALQYAHENGVVHRDIKPENVLIDQDGKVRIADFGLAKVLAADGANPTLTRTMQGLGTPHYMAPEQLSAAGKVDHRADIYSLGVMLYELLTGELPIGRFAPPSQKAKVGSRVDRAVLRTLESEPERRYQQASDLKADLAGTGVRPAGAAERYRREIREAREGGKAPDGKPLPVLAWGSIGGFAVVLIASFMNWVSASWSTMNARIHADAWHTSSLFGIPMYLITFAAAGIAVVRTLRLRGYSIRRAVPFGLAIYGALHSSMAVLGFLIGSSSRPGAGGLITMVAMIWWLVNEWREAAAERRPNARVRRSRRRSSARRR